jgi:uncharacterized membrane protein (UPF0136 family)
MTPAFMISAPAVLYFYGTFLICCGIASVLLIGAKAKTALISGGMSGIVSLVTGYFISTQAPGAQIAGIMVSLALFGVFSWRSAKTLFKVFELIPAADPALNGKGTAFLIISLMAVVSVFVTALQVIAQF